MPPMEEGNAPIEESGAPYIRQDFDGATISKLDLSHGIVMYLSSLVDANGGQGGRGGDIAAHNRIYQG